MRIALLSPQDQLIGHLDNTGSESLHYWNEELHEYLLGTTSTLTMTCDAQHRLSPQIKEGCKLAFRLGGKDYYMNIVDCYQDDEVIELEAWALCLDLTLENEEAYTADKAYPASYYIAKYNWEGMLVLGRNEVADKSIKCTWEGESTLLDRLYSIATNFSAEIEFVPVINGQGSLQQITVNLYRAHDDKYQGIGKRKSQILRTGKTLTKVKRRGDITDLYTAIKPYGKDRMGLTSIAGREVKDENGSVLFFVDSMGYIRAPQSMAAFPSANTKLTNSYNRYIVRKTFTDHETVESLWTYGLGELKKHCLPKVSYEIQGVSAAGIGDTVIVADSKFNPPLYIETRITEQIRDLSGQVKSTVYSSDEFSYPENVKQTAAALSAEDTTMKILLGEV